MKRCDEDVKIRDQTEGIEVQQNCLRERPPTVVGESDMAKRQG